MHAILANLAMLDLIAFCKAHNIDCSGSHLYKYPRRWTYALLNDETGRAIVTVSFTKNSTPVHVVHN